ncbi:hypothetical protein J3P89_18240 [Pseudomonas sp. Z1-14]|uniref:hypothetical protein n=1 Tax=Pseudomonas sp. Z1-14 TaxID=2817409 RepID=UPI003DA8018A
MNQYDELKRLAEKATPGPWECREAEGSAAICHAHGWVADGFDEQTLVDTRFMAAANPSAVLALIAENEELGRYLCTCRDCGGEGALHTGDWHSYGHMEPPEPVMEKCGECDGTGLLGEIQDLYQVITDRGQLRAEVAGLKTGYQAYERVNAELKAEADSLTREADRQYTTIEAYRKDAERYQWLLKNASVILDKKAAYQAVTGFIKFDTMPARTETESAIDAAMGKGERS